MNRLLIILLLWAVVPTARAAAPAPAEDRRPEAAVQSDSYATLREAIARGDARYMPAYEALKKFCDKQLALPAYSVTDKQLTPPSGDKHDYVSMGRYWWPDPSKPDGLPYIRRDGHSNPELKKLDRDRMGRMMNAVTKLALLYRLGGDERYAAKAAELLRTWFLDPATKMNPHLRFGQFVPGHNDNKGRAEGLIDTYGMVAMLEGVAALERAGQIPADEMEGLRGWFGAFLDWMLTSEQGLAEQRAKNNHAVAYDVQVAAYARFVGRDETAEEVLRAFPERRIFTQVEPDGSQPHELARETGFGYSIFNLRHMLDLCVLAGEQGPAIYAASSPDGRSIRAAVGYMARYLGKPQSAFPYRQIKDWESAQESLAWILLRATQFEPNAAYSAAFAGFDRLDPAATEYLLYGTLIR